MKFYITNSAAETKKLGELLASEILSAKRFDLFRSLRPREVEPLIIALKGELGSGKTTFTQGLLKGLKIKGPHTSPTFIVIKQYKKRLTCDKKHLTKCGKISSNVKCQMSNVYHIDAYRVTARDILNLGWEEIIKDKNNIIIVEWADRVKKIIPNPPAGRVLWIKFKWIDENKRKIIFGK